MISEGALSGDSNGQHEPAPVPAGDVVARAAERLSPFLDDQARRLVRDAVDRARTGRPRVLVLGEAKRGKTSLVNAITGRAVLPTGALPLTSVATAVRLVGTDSGEPESARARARNGSWRAVPIAAVAELVSERGNPGNRENIDHVELTLAGDRLPCGTELVDTPGTGSVHELNTMEAGRAREVLDLAILVVSVDPPLSRAELDLLTEAHQNAARSAVVLNKVDLAGRSQVEEVLGFTRSVLAERLEGLPVFALSARTGDGVGDFLAWLNTQLRTHGARDADISARGLLRRLGSAARDSVRVERELRRADRDDARTRQEALEAVLNRARARTSVAAGGLESQGRRLRRGLDDAHRHAVTKALEVAHAAAGATFTAAADAIPEQASSSARATIGEQLTHGVRSWFDQQSTGLQLGLQTAADQSLGELREDLAAARSAAGELLDLTLTDVVDPESPVPWRPPTLSLSPGPVWEELITATVARRLPARWRRRRLRRDASRWAEATGPRLFGQARALLQSELETATRVLSHAVEQEWDRHLAALEHGLEAVRDAERQRLPQDADHLEALAAREHAINQALDTLIP